MVLSKRLKSISVVLLAAGVSVGLGSRVFLHEARAEKPAAAEKPAKPLKAVKPAIDGSTVNGTIQAVDATKKTVTLNVRIPDSKETKAETFPLGEASVVLEHGLKKNETKPGQLSDLLPGTPVTVQLTADKKALAKISVHGGTLHGSIKSVDAAEHTVTIGVKDGKQLVEKTVELVSEGKVFLDDGLGTKKDPPKEGKFADLSEGTAVYIQLSGYGRQQAVSIRATGPTYNGTVGGVDVGNSTITISVKEDGSIVEKTLPIHKNVRFKGKLADITAGAHASLQLSIEDKKTVVGIHLSMK